MKKSILLGSMFLFSSLAQAGDHCTNEIQKVFSNLAPRTGVLKVTGKYAKKSQSGEFKACSLAFYQDGDRLVPIFNPEEFNPTNGDGGAFWPFATYPTVEIPTDKDRYLLSYKCSASEKDFSVDYTFKARYDWRRTGRTTLALKLNEDGSYSISLRDGKGSVLGSPTMCTGVLSEVEKK